MQAIITCAHCVSPNLYIYHPANPTKKLSVQPLKIDKHRDLAILTTPTEAKDLSPIPFRAGPPLKDGDGVILVGYPNHFLARPVRIEPGKLIRTFPKSAVTYLEATSKIIGGNSGGPLLDNEHRLVGVAVLGLNGSTTLNAAEFCAVGVGEINSWLKQS